MSDLLERFREGDREAFAALYREHFPAVFRFALYMTGDRCAPVRLPRTLSCGWSGIPANSIPKRGDLGAFLGGVARKMLHRQERIDRRWLPLEDSARDRTDFAAGVERDQEAAEVRRAIAALPERYREALVLCDLQGKSYEEAAAALGCANGTVKSRLHRARALLACKFQRRREGQKCV